MTRLFLGLLSCLVLAGAPGCGGKPSVKQLRVLATQGDVEAQYQLALRYASGDGVPADIATAVGWHRTAAAQGHSGAQLALGQAMAQGAGVPKDILTALHWYRQAAERGLRPAQLALGTTLLLGKDLPADPVGGYIWLKVAGATITELEGNSLEAIEASLTSAQREEAAKRLGELAIHSPRR